MFKKQIIELTRNHLKLCQSFYASVDQDGSSLIAFKGLTVQQATQLKELYDSF